jgi:FtsH-binding integral membrane protein
MIIALPPESATWIRVTARAVLLLHIGGAGVGLVAGAAALAAPKGGPWHRWAGNTFFVSMITMSLIGAATAPLLPTPDWQSMFVGLLTFYLVATAWISIRRKSNGVHRIDIGALVWVAAVAIVAASFGVHDALGAGGERVYAVPDFVFGSIAALAAVLDLRAIRRGGSSKPQRVMRHLWRMCVALLIAAFSFFVGQQKVLPHAVQGSPLLLVPEIAVLGTMLYYIFRTRRARPAAALAAAA